MGGSGKGLYELSLGQVHEHRAEVGSDRGRTA